MIVSQPSKSRPTSMRRRIVVRPDAPAAAFRIGTVRRKTRGPSGQMRDNDHGQWAFPCRVVRS
jgi:hypothetical protein